jgi:hypothetical protein
MIAILLLVGIILFILWILGLTLRFITGPLLWIIFVIALIALIVWAIRALFRHV